MNTYFPTDYQAFIHTSRYAKWLNKENRRENWGETVDRYVTNLGVLWRFFRRASVPSLQEIQGHCWHTGAF